MWGFRAAHTRTVLIWEYPPAPSHPRGAKHIHSRKSNVLVRIRWPIQVALFATNHFCNIACCSTGSLLEGGIRKELSSFSKCGLLVQWVSNISHAGSKSNSILPIYKEIQFKMTDSNGAKMTLQYICACIMAVLAIRTKIFRLLSPDE